MNYRYFKPADKMVSLLGFGTMRLPVIGGNAAHIDENAAIRMIRHAIDSGVNYVDTAYMYHGGRSETVTGKALKDGYRERVLLADKMPVWLAKSSDEMAGIFDEQLKRLDTDFIDLYLVHNVNKAVWDRAVRFGIVDFLEAKRAEGRIKYIGFSYHDDAEFFKTVVDAYPWDFCQIQLNYMDARLQAGVEGLKHAGSKGIPVVVMEPLKGGKLTDAVPDSVLALWDSADIHRTPAEWALRWVADFPEVLTILSGMTTYEQVEENIRILSDAAPNTLTEKERELINRASDEYNRLIRASCTGCRYCLPCPMKLQIPDLLNYYNEWFLYGQNPKVQADFNMFINPKARPSACSGCRACEEKCPQQLPISDIMKEMAELFEKK